MIRAILLMTCMLAFYLGARTGLAELQKSQSTSSRQSSSSGEHRTTSGVQSVVGCVAKEGDAFVLKSDEGTYEFNTDRDLTPYVGKKVRIAGHWQATGVTTTAPVKAAGTAGGESSAGDSHSTAQSFVGDLHLHITGDVIGDCGQSK